MGVATRDNERPGTFDGAPSDDDASMDRFFLGKGPACAVAAVLVAVLAGLFALCA